MRSARGLRFIAESWQKVGSTETAVCEHLRATSTPPMPILVRLQVNPIARRRCPGWASVADAPDGDTQHLMLVGEIRPQGGKLIALVAPPLRRDVTPPREPSCVAARELMRRELPRCAPLLARDPRRLKWLRPSRARLLRRAGSQHAADRNVNESYAALRKPPILAVRTDPYPPARHRANVATRTSSDLGRHRVNPPQISIEVADCTRRAT